MAKSVPAHDIRAAHRSRRSIRCDRSVHRSRSRASKLNVTCGSHRHPSPPRTRRPGPHRPPSRSTSSASAPMNGGVEPVTVGYPTAVSWPGPAARIASHTSVSTASALRSYRAQITAGPRPGTGGEVLDPTRTVVVDLAGRLPQHGLAASGEVRGVEGAFVAGLALPDPQPLPRRRAGAAIEGGEGLGQHVAGRDELGEPGAHGRVGVEVHGQLVGVPQRPALEPEPVGVPGQQGTDPVDAAGAGGAGQPHVGGDDQILGDAAVGDTLAARVRPGVQLCRDLPAQPVDVLGAQACPAVLGLQDPVPVPGPVR